MIMGNNLATARALSCLLAHIQGIADGTVKRTVPPRRLKELNQDYI